MQKTLDTLVDRVRKMIQDPPQNTLIGVKGDPVPPLASLAPDPDASTTE